VREAAELLDLTRYLDRKPKALSGGQRQRVAMGRAIVREPAVFLMDEPLSNLDAKLRVETRANIAELQARLGTTTVYVTHDQVEAMTMGHRVAVLQAGGFLQQVDTPRNLYDRPANVFVAGFMGSPSMNIVKLKTTDTGVRFGGEDVPLKQPIMDEIRKLGLTEVTFGVRPESLGLADPGMPVTIDLVEELGADAFVHAHTPDGDRIVIRADARLSLHQGSVVKAHVSDLDNLHVFHPETGERLGSAAGL
jgi:multiple sugar transport system ATP-binding protein